MPKTKTRTVETTTEQTDDAIVIVSRESRPKQIDFADILAACRIEDDDYHAAPWETCDGYEHEATPASRIPDEADASSMQGYAYHDRCRWVITVDDADVKSWGNFDHYRKQGASRQVAAEMVAAVKAQTIAQLVKWYENGWNYYCVVCEFYDVFDSLGGIDDYDYAQNECREDVAMNVAHELEAAGHIVVNKPTRAVHRGYTLEGFKEHLTRNLASQSWPLSYRRTRR